MARKRNGLLILGLLLAPVLVAGRIPGRYIVELEGAPASERLAKPAGRARFGGAAAEGARALVWEEQDRMRARLAGQGATVVDSVDTVANALIVDVADADAEALRQIPGVKRVLPVRELHMVLDHAEALSKVPDAWARIGQEHAGEGMKVAIIDSGIEATHPAFQDTTMAAPDGFPRVTYDLDKPFTSGKIIVARSYISLLRYRDLDYSTRDHVGHGTALATIAAGVTNQGPLGPLTGVAPRAWIGVYKVFGTPGYNDSTNDAAVIKALDEAVSDGMDVINLSLGDDEAPRLADDLEVQAVQRAVQAGVIVVVAAGNNGPGMNTINSPGSTPEAITVGASTSDRTFGASVEVAGLGYFVTSNGNGTAPANPVSARLADVAALDGDGLACNALPGGSLSGRIALIQRGTCTFETKLSNAQNAGAAGGLVYAAEAAPGLFSMNVGAATLPAQSLSRADGLTIKGSLASGAEVTATMRFTVGAVPRAGARMTDFTGIGPNVDVGIKPDLLATGSDIYVATQTFNPSGDMYSSLGYTIVDGTSFATPLVAGAAALVKAARPGLTVDQYRSLLINTAAPVTDATGATVGVQNAGAGLLNVDAALRSTAAAYPVSLSFGAGSGTISAANKFTLTNVSGATESFALNVTPRAGGSAPVLDKSTLELVPGAAAEIAVNWTASDLASGTYDGFLTATGLTSGTTVNVPYWYAVKSADAAQIVLLYTIGSARRGSIQQDAFDVRVTDANGVILTDVTPVVTPISGGGSVLKVVNYDQDIPGVFGVDVQLGATAGANTFRVQVGNVTLDVTLTGA